MGYYIEIGDVEVRVAYIAIVGYIIFCLSTLCISWLFFKEKAGINILKHAPKQSPENYDPSAFNADININVNSGHRMHKLGMEIDLAKKLRIKRKETEIQMMHMKLEPNKETISNTEEDDDSVLDNINLLIQQSSTDTENKEELTEALSPTNAGYIHLNETMSFILDQNMDTVDVNMKKNEVRVTVKEEEEDDIDNEHSKLLLLLNKLSLYITIFFHFWDVATDLAVICDWIPSSNWRAPNASLSSSEHTVNTFYFIIASILCQLIYRSVSGYRYSVRFNICGGILQFLDIQIFFEIYSSINSKKGKSTLQLRWIRRMESVLESAPQAFIQLVYVLSVNQYTHNVNVSNIVGISLLFSFFSITLSVVRSDEWKIREGTKANVMCPPNWRFIVRSTFRLFEIMTRLFIIALLSQINVLLVVLLCFIEIIFYLIMYKDGLLGNDIGNIAEILIAHPNLSLRISDEELETKRESVIGCIFRSLCCWSFISGLFVYCNREKRLKSSKWIHSNLVSVHFIHRCLESIMELTVFMIYRSHSFVFGSFVVFMFIVAIFGVFCVPFLYLISYRWFIIGGTALEMNVFGLLYHAHCSDDMTQFMRYVFRVKSSVNDKNTFNRTPLMEAVLLNDYDICKFLCSITSYIDLSINDGKKQIIHYVAEIGDDRLMKLILDANTLIHNCSAQHAVDIDAIYGKYGKNALIICSEMGYTACIQLLLNEGVNINYQDKLGRTALHYAIFGDYSLMIGYILSFDPDLSLCDNKRGWNPLFQSVGGGHIETVDLLINRSNAHPDSIDIRGDSLLHIAVRYNRFNVLKYLLTKTHRHWNSLHKNNECFTPLKLAISCQHIVCSKYLIQFGNETPKALCEALLISVKRNYHKMVTLLMDEFKVSPNFTDKESMTPLRWAAFKGHKLICKELLIGGATDDLDEFGQNIVFYAAKNNHLNILKLLQKANADFCVVNFDGQTATDKTNDNHIIQFIQSVRDIQIHCLNH